jgi:hypothetical protein
MRSFMVFTPYQILFVAQIKENYNGRTCGTYGAEKTCLRSFGGEHEGKMHLGRHRHRWEDSNKMDVKN